MRTKKLPKKPRWKDKIDPAFDKIKKNERKCQTFNCESI